MRSYAVIPPLLLDSKQRRIAFQNRNGLLQPEELEGLHSERKLINVWSSIEHELFKEKYISHPKNFGAIGQSFDRSTLSHYTIKNRNLKRKKYDYFIIIRTVRSKKKTVNKFRSHKHWWKKKLSCNSCLVLDKFSWGFKLKVDGKEGKPSSYPTALIKRCEYTSPVFATVGLANLLPPSHSPSLSFFLSLPHSLVCSLSLTLDSLSLSLTTISFPCSGTSSRGLSLSALSPFLHLTSLR